MPPSARIASAAVTLALACGSDPTDTVGATDTTTAVSSTSTTTTAAPTTTAATTTTAEPACAGVALPHGLPTGTQATYWVASEDMDTQETTLRVGLVRDTYSCSEGAPFDCTADDPVRLFGYSIVLAPGQQKTGVYPVTDSLPGDGVHINAIMYEWTGDTCALRMGLAAASDGEVEVLALEDTCISVDVRGVTPIAYQGLVLDPNGSGQALQCGE